MKKNVIFRIAAIVLMCTLVTACFASSTFAKYTSSATVNGNALTVAKWSFKVQNEEIAVTGSAPTVNVNLFDTILDTKDSADETDVATNKIAPGTKGALDLKVQNTSEVNATYTITVTRTCANADLKNAIVVKYDGAAISWSGDTATLVTDEPIDMNSAVTTLPITWEWEFGDPANNTRDTGIGIAVQSGAVTYDLDFTIVANQVD